MFYLFCLRFYFTISYVYFSLCMVLLLWTLCFYLNAFIFYSIKMLVHSYLLCTLIRLHNNDFNLVFRVIWQQNLSYDSYTAWKTGFFLCQLYVMSGRGMPRRNSHVVQSNKILNILIIIQALELIGSVIVQIC